VKELQDFADAFTHLVEVLTEQEYEPFESIIPPVEEDPLEPLRYRLLAIENRLKETHRLVDQHDIRLDAHLSRIGELEIRAMLHNGKKEM